MAIGFARPDVAELVLRCFNRPVHPELFESVADTHLAAPRYMASARLTKDGHVLEFRSGGATVTEVAATRSSPLPEQGRFLDKRLVGYRTHMLELPGLRYHCSFQLEPAPPDIFLHLHRELETDAADATLFSRLGASRPGCPDSLSLLKWDQLPEGLVTHSFHTYPDNSAILRIQTLFELL